MTDYGNWFDAATAERPVNLSADAAARRDALRAQLCDTVVRRRRRRSAFRATVAAVLVVGGAFAAWSGHDSSTSRLFADPVQIVSAPFELQHADFAVVQDSDAVLSRYAPSSRELPREIFLDDDGLLHRLIEIDRPATLLRTEDRVVIYPDVADSLGD